MKIEINTTRVQEVSPEALKMLVYIKNELVKQKLFEEAILIRQIEKCFAEA